MEYFLSSHTTLILLNSKLIYIQIFITMSLITSNLIYCPVNWAFQCETVHKRSDVLNIIFYVISCSIKHLSGYIRVTTHFVGNNIYFPTCFSIIYDLISSFFVETNTFFYLEVRRSFTHVRFIAFYPCAIMLHCRKDRIWYTYIYYNSNGRTCYPGILTLDRVRFD